MFLKQASFCFFILLPVFYCAFVFIIFTLCASPAFSPPSLHSEDIMQKGERVKRLRMHLRLPSCPVCLLLLRRLVGQVCNQSPNACMWACVSNESYWGQ